MVSDAVEVPLAVPSVDVGSGEILPVRGGGAVDDDRVDCSHDSLCIC